MNCRNAENIMQDSLDRDLTPAERAALDTHTAACQACREAWEGYRLLSGFAASWARETPETGISDDMFAARLIGRIEAGDMGRSGAAAPSTPIWQRWLAAAACTALVAGIVTIARLYWPAFGVSGDLHPADLLPRPADAPSAFTWLAGMLRDLPGAALRVGLDLLARASAPAWTVVAITAALAANAALYLRAAAGRGRGMLR
jgi:hypothetical protein